MLSEEKHLRWLSFRDGPNKNDLRFFASLRMTISVLLRHSTIRHSFEPRHSSFVIYLLLGLLAVIGTAFAEKRPINEKDLFDFVWIGDVQVSPDGSRVAFVRVTVNEKKEGYNTSIWSVPVAGGEAPHQLTKGDHDSAPRWSPDGKFLLFLRAMEKDGKPEPPQLSILPMLGGDSFSFTDLPKGASNPVWASDGKTIAFASDTTAEDLAKQEKKKRKEEELKKAVRESSPSPTPATKGSEKQAATPKHEPDAAAKKAEAEAEHESDIHVITRAVYREDNEGYLDPKHPTHLWIVPAPRTAAEKVQPNQLTSGRSEEGNIVWSKDSAQIYFTSLRIDEPYYELPKTELYSINPNGGNATKLNSIEMGMDAVL